MAILRYVLCVAIVLVVAVSPVVAQVVAGPRGPVEFLGLEDWNAPDLLEAIQKLAPDKPIAQESEHDRPEFIGTGHQSGDVPRLTGGEGATLSRHHRRRAVQPFPSE